jgi:cardiolipin synthase (CMP-forming)
MAERREAIRGALNETSRAGRRIPYVEQEPRHESAIERAAVGEDEAKAPAVSDAILTIPNLITFARLALIPVFIWLGIGVRNTGAAWVVGFVAGSTDFIDGRVARRLGQVSKLGIAMDPLSDRILVFAAAWVFLDRGYAPAWTLIVVVARDALLLAALPVIAGLGVERPAVSWFGKAGTMGVMTGFGMFMAAHIPDRTNDIFTVLGWLCYIPGLVFSYMAAAGYFRDVIRARSRTA